MSSRRTCRSLLLLGIRPCPWSVCRVSRRMHLSSRGRKYKAPPATSHVEVTVVKKFNGKPISNAAVIFHPTMDGKDEGNLEVKTDPEGKATIDVIPTGSTVRVQVIAHGLCNLRRRLFGQRFHRKRFLSRMIRPQEQISSYVDNEGKAANQEARCSGANQANHSSRQTCTHAAACSICNPTAASYRSKRTIAVGLRR